MRSKVVKSLTLVLALTGASVVLGQPQYPGAKDGVAVPPKPEKKDRQERFDPFNPNLPKTATKKSRLEELLAEALKHNADIRVAEAKLAEANAELNRTRVEVTQKVVTLYHAIQSQKALVEYEQQKFTRFKELETQRAIDVKLMDEQTAKLTAAKAKLAELEAQMPALLGKTVIIDFDNDGRLDLEFLNNYYRKALLAAARLKRESARSKVDGPLAERMRKALQTSVPVSYKETPLTRVFKDLEKNAPGLSMRDLGLDQFKVTLHFDEALPVSAVLQALADDYDLHITVRAYGIRVTPSTFPVPPGALSVEEFLRQPPAEQPQPQPARTVNPPTENVEGVVKSVDASSGLMTITIGSNAGLQKGHTLELFRLDKQPKNSKYLGRIRILEVKPTEAVAQPVGRLSAPPQVGDRVSSRIGDK